jgi:hypothetical protein
MILRIIPANSPQRARKPCPNDWPCRATTEVNPPQRSTKQREKSGLAVSVSGANVQRAGCGKTRSTKALRVFLKSRAGQPRVSRLTPSICALTAVAPIVRFNALDIFVTPTFLRASDFNSRISDEVHARLAADFFFFISILIPVDETGLLAQRLQ